VVYDNFVHGADAEVVRRALAKFAGTEQRRDQLESTIVNQLSALGYPGTILKAFVGQVFGMNKPSLGEIEKEIFLRLPPWNQLTPWAQP